MMMEMEGENVCVCKKMGKSLVVSLLLFFPHGPRERPHAPTHPQG